MAFLKIVEHKGIPHVTRRQLNSLHLVRNQEKILLPILSSSCSPRRTTFTSATAVKDVTHTQTPRRDPLDLSFANPEAAFKSKTTWEVFRAYIVYQLCSSQYLVDNNMKVSVNIQLFGRKLTFRLDGFPAKMLLCVRKRLVTHERDECYWQIVWVFSERESLYLPFFHFLLKVRPKIRIYRYG